MNGILGRIRGFVLFLYDFVVGDDWHVAVAIVVAMAVTAIVAHHGGTAWWIVPLALVLVLPYTVWRVVRASSRDS